MTAAFDPIPIPRSESEFADLHQEVASGHALAATVLGEELAREFGADAAHRAMRGLLIPNFLGSDDQAEENARFNRLGWREYLETGQTGLIDFIAATQPWIDAAMYWAQGLAPRLPDGSVDTLTDRELRVREICAWARAKRHSRRSIFGVEFLFIADGVLAREALDFGGTLTPEGVALLAGLSLASVRNAISAGHLATSRQGGIVARDAQKWLCRRRSFYCSRWRDLNDDQWPFDPEALLRPDADGRVYVPQDATGTPFTPEHVIRRAKSTGEPSITVGRKGNEQRYSDFYEALLTLAASDSAHWRRRNATGQWGIVRAHGPWIRISKADIDRQLATKREELDR